MIAVTLPWPGAGLSPNARQHYMALARARKLLEDAGVKFSEHKLVGKPWDVISEYASAHLCDLIVMGSRGLGTHTGALLGSVALGVAQRSTVPLLLVK